MLPKAQAKLQLLLSALEFPESSLHFFCIIPWVVLYSSVIVRFAGFLLRISCHSNVSEKFDFCFTEFRKATACLCMTHTAPTLTLTLSYMRKYTWKKDIGQRKVHKPVK